MRGRTFFSHTICARPVTGKEQTPVGECCCEHSWVWEGSGNVERFNVSGHRMNSNCAGVGILSIGAPLLSSMPLQYERWKGWCTSRTCGIEWSECWKVQGRR